MLPKPKGCSVGDPLLSRTQVAKSFNRRSKNLTLQESRSNLYLISNKGSRPPEQLCPGDSGLQSTGSWRHLSDTETAQVSVYEAGNLLV